VGVGEDDNVLQLVAHLAGHDVERHDPLERVTEELQADRRLLVGRVDLDRVPPGPERAADEVHVVAVVLELDDAAEQVALVVLLPHLQGHRAVAVLVG
jgi:hypothetical protein